MDLIDDFSISKGDDVVDSFCRGVCFFNEFGYSGICRMVSLLKRFTGELSKTLCRWN